MDLYCQVCGEPYELDYIEHELSHDAKGAFYAGVGCEACKWGANKPARRPFNAELASAMADIMGDDIDGIAAAMEDAEYLLGDDFWD